MKGKPQTETAILKDILKGKYREHYLLYARKSTDDEDLQKNSILFQKKENIRYARQNGIKIAEISLAGFARNGIIAEKHSAFKVAEAFEVTEAGQMILTIERPKFHKLVYYLNRKCFRGVIVYCWDRACRNEGDEVALKRLMQNGADIRFVTTRYEKSSAGALHMDIDGMFATHHSRVTSEKVTTATRHLRQQGICTYKAPVGYLNTGDATWKPLDPQRAPIVRGMFEKYSSGEWTLSSLARWANDQGFTMPPMRRRRSAEEILDDDGDDDIAIEKCERPVTYNRVHGILSNKFYAGYIKGAGQDAWIPSKSHEPLVSLALFERVQGLLHKKAVSRHYQSLLPRHHRKFLRCRHCNRVYSPYVKKGILYFAPKCAEGCANRLTSLNIGYLEGEIGTLLSRLYFTSGELAEFEARAESDAAHLEARHATKMREAERKRRKLREDLRYLQENKLTLLKTGAYSAEDLVLEEERLTEAINGLQAEEAVSQKEMRDTLKSVVTSSELLKSLTTTYHFANSDEREQIARIIFSELYIDQNSLSFRLTSGMKPFETRLCAVCAPIEWLSELHSDLKEIQSSIETLKSILR